MSSSNSFTDTKIRQSDKFKEIERERKKQKKSSLLFFKSNYLA
jgi:hypothetical protein